MGQRRFGWPGWSATGAAFGLGAVVATGQAPLGFWWLTLLGFAALVRLVTLAADARRAAWLGLFGGAGYFALALSWIIEPFLIDVARYGWMAPFAVVLLSFGLALFWALAAGLAGLLPRGPAHVLAFAGALGAVELARGYVLTGFPWALIGHVWIDTPLAQVAALIGPSGLTLLTVVAVALPVAFRWQGLVVGIAVLTAGLGFGMMRLAEAEPGARGVTLRLVQPNADQRVKWEPDVAGMLFNRQLSYTAVLPSPDLVIWPETAVPYLLEGNPEVAEAMATVAAGSPVIAGVQRYDGTQAWNSLVVIGDGGLITATYDKHHLVPFGEYIPFGDVMFEWFGVQAFAARQGNGYVAGPGAQVIDLGGKLGRFVPLICYEAVFPQDLRGLPERPDWILQITNDAWFGTLTGPYQHLAQARFRAIEQGLPLVRVANTGISAVIDARGRVVAELPRGVPTYLDAGLPGAMAVPPYAKWGETPVLVLLAGLGAWVLMRGRQRRA
jgi:apolipoprotein N-acyltransferase